MSKQTGSETANRDITGNLTPERLLITGIGIVGIAFLLVLFVWILPHGGDSFLGGNVGSTGLFLISMIAAAALGFVVFVYAVFKWIGGGNAVIVLVIALGMTTVFLFLGFGLLLAVLLALAVSLLVYGLIRMAGSR